MESIADETTCSEAWVVGMSGVQVELGPEKEDHLVVGMSINNSIK